jgi:hypothetical protein
MVELFGPNDPWFGSRGVGESGQDASGRKEN